MKVKYIARIPTDALVKNKVYEVLSKKGTWYWIMTELGEEYLFPPELFEIVEE